MVVRLTKERDELKLENKELVEENLQLIICRCSERDKDDETEEEGRGDS